MSNYGLESFVQSALDKALALAGTGWGAPAHALLALVALLILKEKYQA